MFYVTCFIIQAKNTVLTPKPKNHFQEIDGDYNKTHTHTHSQEEFCENNVVGEVHLGRELDEIAWSYQGKEGSLENQPLGKQQELLNTFENRSCDPASVCHWTFYKHFFLSFGLICITNQELFTIFLRSPPLCYPEDGFEVGQYTLKPQHKYSAHPFCWPDAEMFVIFILLLFIPPLSTYSIQIYTSILFCRSQNKSIFVFHLLFQIFNHIQIGQLLIIVVCVFAYLCDV